MAKQKGTKDVSALFVQADAILNSIAGHFEGCGLTEWAEKIDAAATEIARIGEDLEALKTPAEIRDSLVWDTAA